MSKRLTREMREEIEARIKRDRSSFSQGSKTEGVVKKYQIVCIDSEKETWTVIHNVDTKREAKEWVENNREKCAPTTYMNFVRRGFTPMMGNGK